jgi:hypothetical protein
MPAAGGLRNLWDGRVVTSATPFIVQECVHFGGLPSSIPGNCDTPTLAPRAFVPAWRHGGQERTPAGLIDEISISTLA